MIVSRSIGCFVINAVISLAADTQHPTIQHLAALSSRRVEGLGGLLLLLFQGGEGVGGRKGGG